MSEGLLLGVDIGTSSSKGVLVTREGTILARAYREHGTSSPCPGWFEHDAETVWWQDFRAIVRELLSACAPQRVDAVGISGIGPTLLPADSYGNPLRPAILYGVDTRASSEIDELTEELGNEAILRHAGTVLSSQAVGPKFRWLANHEPEVYKRTELFLMCSSYLVHRLTGEYVLDHQSASQAVPMYDLAARQWSPWAERVAPGIELPRLVWPTDIAGRITAVAAAETGLPQGIPVTGGVVDAWSEAFSAGVAEPGATMIMYGTTMFLIDVLTDPLPRQGLWTTCGAVPGTYTLAAGMATSGSITDWLRRISGRDYAELAALAAGAPAGSKGLLLLPYFAGERTPMFDPDARGMLAGLTLGHGIGELYRAALEGIAYGVRHNLETMRAAGGAASRLVAVGGGTTGGLWTQIVSDVTGAEQQVPAETVGACFGNAMLAAVAVGDSPRGWNPIVRTVTPDARRYESYNEYYRRYRELYPATEQIAHFLAEQQRLSG